MALNFNVDPYYDDFDPSKNFHRILFKPGVAVQARELTQSQTILQSQISKFADNIFSQNTPVTGGQVTVNQNCYYLKLNAQYNSVDIVAGDFTNKIIQDSTGQVIAKVIKTAEATGTDAAAGDPPTLIVTYLSGGQFSDGMDIFPADGSNFAATIIGTIGGSTGIGLSSVASISDGVFYIVNGYSQSSTQNEDGSYTRYSIGNFVSVQPQTTILDKYSSTPSYRVGLLIQETIIDYIDDPSLLDPAVGASNYQAPGADRYQIELSLTTLPLELGNDDAFVELLRIENGNVQKQVDNTVYSVIDEYFAKRTSETNGDYIVSNFKITPTANTIDANTYILGVGPGVAYVQGFRLENQSTQQITSDRARTTDSVNNNSNFIDYGNYIYVDNLKGQGNSFFDITTGSPVDFHIVGTTGVNRSNTTTYNSTLAGSGFIRALSYVQASNGSNTQTYTYKAHIFDLASKTISSNVSAANSTFTTLYVGSAGLLSNVANAYVGCSITIDSGTDAGDARTITYYDPNNKTIQTDAAFTVTPDGTSQFSIRFGVKDFETIVQPVTGTPYTFTGSASVSNLGKVNNVASGYTQLFNPGNPQLIFPLGNKFVSAVTDSSYTTLQEFRAQSFASYLGGSRRYLQLDPSSIGVFDFIRTGATESADAIRQNWIVVVTDRLTNTTINNGDVIDFTTGSRSIAVDSDKNGVYLTCPDLAPFAATIYTKLSVTDGNDTNYVLKTKTLVEANTTVASSTGPDGIVNDTYIDLTNAQVWIPTAGVLNYGNNQNLYVSDVKRIVKIIDTNGVTPNVSLLTTGTDITSYYTFNNGQTDNYYGHSYITLKPGRQKPVSLWILFDYFSHSGGDGYFSAQSYTNVGFTDRPKYYAGNGTLYDLKDCLDFRPSVLNGQGNFVFKYKITPTTTNNSGFFIPADLSAFTSDYAYYLGRKDILVIGKDKGLRLIQGVPDINPVFPGQPEGSMLLAKISLDPYTEYVTGQTITGQIANINVQPVLHKRWAFKDITDLQTRVNNLEYYTSLNLLEQKATNLQIPDGDGLNRFKNGILVDDFSTFSVGDTFNPDFSAAINTRLQYLTPAILVKNYPLQNQQLLSVGGFKGLSNTATTGLSYNPTNSDNSPIYTLKYTEEIIASQPLASRSIAINPFAVADSIGTLTLTPPMDNWIDNTKQPDLLFIDPNLKMYQPSSDLNLLEGNPTLAVSDWKTIPGTESTTTKTVSETSVDEYGNSYSSSYNANVTTVDKQNIYTYGYWSQTYTVEGNYITNVSLLPYIRAQQIAFRATDMLFNTTVNAFFDQKRVSRMVRKPNIIELNSVSGTFNVGETIGYVVSSIFTKTGVIADIYTYTNGNVRLYVIGDIGTTSYGATVRNGFFNTSGVYQNSTASGTFVSQTHYSGAFAANTSSANTVTLATTASSSNTAYVGQEFWIVNGSEASVLSIPIGQKATVSSYNGVTKVATLSRNVIAKTGETYSIGALTTNEVGSVSGVFNCPGGYFNVGERTFRLDNRIVTEGATDFFYNKGTETTSAEATFFAQGLSTTSQQINYSASVSGQANTVTTVKTVNDYVTNTERVGGGGGCCVISTAMSDMGIWSTDQKFDLVEWCEKYLHNKTIGECFRRGYQVIGSKIAVPLLRNESIVGKIARVYGNWAFTNGTNMVRGKKFSWLSVPNSLVWIAGFMAVGAVVTTKFANKCWKKLYE
jgi:hypothetical protein